MPTSPLAPIEGDPAQTAAAGRQLSAIAAEVEIAAAQLRALASASSSWTGNAAGSARVRSATVPPKLVKATVSYRVAGSALTTYARALSNAQQLSRSAVAAANRATADLDAARSAQAAAAQNDTAAAASAQASGLPAPVATAPRYAASISEALSRLRQADAVIARAHDEQRSAARRAASQLHEASRQGIRNESWWHRLTSAVGHWASTQWSSALRVLSRVATTISALAGIAALVLAVAGIAFPPLEAAAAVLETISLISAAVAVVSDTALAASGKAAWSAVAFDALALVPTAGSYAVRTLGKVLRGRAVGVTAGEVARAGARDAAQVSDATRSRELAAFADSFRPPGPNDPKTVAMLRTATGRTYLGRSSFSAKVDARIRDKLDSLPMAKRSKFHGRCAEIDCLNQAMSAGEDIAGAHISTARVRGLNSVQHGSAIAPCPTCEFMIDKFGAAYDG